MKATDATCFTESGRPVPCPPVVRDPLWRDLLLPLIGIGFLTFGGLMLVKVVTEPPPASLPLPTNATPVIVNVIAPTPPPVTPGIMQVYVITPTPEPLPTRTAAEATISAEQTAIVKATLAAIPRPCPTNAAAMSGGDACTWRFPTPTPAPTWTPIPKCITPQPGATCQPGGTWLGKPPTATPAVDARSAQ